ncbi:hypothetical protein OpiT1DRAFT_05131 [Opitutaceae bacterium TAV1]|nr:hypothetical protein OpiT1DRAFT_05131 [Opitutaceae bacterium TAV1]
MKTYKTMIIAGMLLGMPLIASAAGFATDFTGVTGGTTFNSDGTLTDQWTQPAGIPGKASVVDESLKIAEGNVTARYRMSGTTLWNVAAGAGELTLDFLRHGSISEVNILLSSYAGNGFFIDLKSSSLDVSTSGSTGGVTGAVTKATHDLTLADDTWYSMKISNFTLSATSVNSVTATLSIFERSNPSNVLLDSITITGTGTGGWAAFNQIDIRRFGGTADTEYILFDNISLHSYTPIPEPSTLAFTLGALALGALFSTRNIFQRNI